MNGEHFTKINFHFIKIKKNQNSDPEHRIRTKDIRNKKIILVVYYIFTKYISNNSKNGSDHPKENTETFFTTAFSKFYNRDYLAFTTK